MSIFVKSIKQIANSKLYSKQLQQHFEGRTAFTSKDIEKFYRAIEPAIKGSTIGWRIYSLVQSGMLSRVGRGKFTLGEGRNFVPDISRKIKTLYRDLHGQFPFVQICIWNNSILNEFMLHQSGRFYMLVETDKETTESVFFFLKEKKKNAFLEPTAEILSRYAATERDVIIIKPLVSEAPVQKAQGVTTVTIEKILVDIFCDEVIFAAQQGSEMRTIFREAFEKYSVNENRMLRYADRRRKKEAFSNYLNKVSKFRQQIQ